MKYLLIPIGIVLLVVAWFASLVADGWDAPQGKFQRGPAGIALLGVGCIVGAFFF